MNAPNASLLLERGFALVEFLVALTIGMLVVLAAVVSLSGTRATSLVTDDSNALQRSSVLIFRLLGQQIRQAGYLPLDTMKPSSYYGGSEDPNFFAIKGVEGGETANDTLTIGYASSADYNEDCLGQANAGPLVTSEFSVVDGNFRCEGSGNSVAQPIAEGVERFDVSYGIAASVQGDQIVRYVAAPKKSESPAFDFNQVRAVRICLQLAGATKTDATGGSYVDCDGKTQTNQAGKLRRVYTSVFALRNNLAGV